MERLIFATNNQHKVDEIRVALNHRYQIISLKEAGINIEIAEPHDTLEKNAWEKAFTIHQLTGENCFSEDTGLEVFSLHGEPGVKSARYAGDECSFDKNIQKLLENMSGIANREARFRTIITLILDTKEYHFEGVCDGHIITEKKGTMGFGYDPVFVPGDSAYTFAEMNMAEKNKYSHRKKAVDKMIAFLQNYQLKASE
jgi:XTP/dITP diphosphohydrolase